MGIYEIIRDELKKCVTEANDPGIAVTKKNHSESGKINKEANKNTGLNLKPYTAAGLKKDEFKPPKRELSADDKEKEDFSRRGGMENLVYDGGVDDKFKDRQTKAIKGDSSMGNKSDDGGASGEEFGEKLIDRVKKIKKLKNDATKPMIQFGDDIEMLDDEEETVLSKKKVAVESIKRLTFKKPFKDDKHAVSLIPESYKKDSKEFEITDGDNYYRVRWVGNIVEGFVPWFALNGKVIGDIEIISHVNKSHIDEGFNKMNRMFDALSQKKHITRSGVNENAVLKDMVSRNRKEQMLTNLIKEAKIYNLTESDLDLSVDLLTDKIMMTEEFETKADAEAEAKRLIKTRREIK